LKNKSFGVAITNVIFAYLILLPLANAGTILMNGLDFESKNQSMWGSGTSFKESESLFLGAQWSNTTASIGGIAGSSNATIIPEIPSYQISPYIPPQQISPKVPAVWSPYVPAVRETIWEPAIWIPNPSWSDPFNGYWKGCACTKTVSLTPEIPSFQISPEIPAVYSPEVPAVYSPYIPAITGDTRTGAELEITSSGKIGLELGYTIDSGSIDSSVNFSALIDIPDVILSSGVVDLNTSSTFDSGTIFTQSPQIQASINAIMELSGAIDATACAIALGCTTGSTSLPSVSMNQSVFSIDPNSIKFLDGILPGDKPLAELPLAKTTFSLSGGATFAPPAVGFKVTAHGVTVMNTLPPTPAITADLASVKLELPDISTSGNKSVASIVSGGRDDILTAHLDLDGVATFAAGLPALGAKLDLIDAGGIKLQASLDLMDVDAGPVLGVTQDFEIIPTLMVDLNFSNAIEILGLSGMHTSWSGLWGNLPSFSLLETTTFMPEFWIDAMLKNDFGLDLGLTGTMDLMKLGATGSAGGISLLNFGPISLNSILDISNELFSTEKFGISIYDDMFAFGGFNRIMGQEFTLFVDERNVGKLVSQVDEPTTLILFLFGLLWVIYHRKIKANMRLHSYYLEPL
tara:strand:+ start:9277 stop:11172 length:1896 start_codon:yes stop_codon:yes gene_type:complete